MTAVNRIGDSEPLTSELIAVAEGVDSLVRERVGILLILAVLDPSSG